MTKRCGHRPKYYGIDEYCETSRKRKRKEQEQKEEEEEEGQEQTRRCINVQKIQAQQRHAMLKEQIYKSLQDVDADMLRSGWSVDDILKAPHQVVEYELMKEARLDKMVMKQILAIRSKLNKAIANEARWQRRHRIVQQKQHEQEEQEEQEEEEEEEEEKKKNPRVVRLRRSKRTKSRKVMMMMVNRSRRSNRRRRRSRRSRSRSRSRRSNHAADDDDTTAADNDNDTAAATAAAAAAAANDNRDNDSDLDVDVEELSNIANSGVDLQFIHQSLGISEAELNDEEWYKACQEKLMQWMQEVLMDIQNNPARLAFLIHLFSPPSHPQTSSPSPPPPPPPPPSPTTNWSIVSSTNCCL